MKKYMLSAMMMMATVALMAQPPHAKPGEKGKNKPDKAEIEAQFIAYITKELSLTPEEAKVFWPVHDKYREEMKALHKERRELMKERKAGEELTDAQVEELIQKHFSIKDKELALEKKYHTEFKKVLPVKKVAKLYRAEQQFKRDILKEMKE